MGLPETVTRRPATSEDAAAVAAIAAADATAVAGRPSRIGLSDVFGWWRHVELERNSWLLEEGGRALAVGWFELHGNSGMYFGVVAPGETGRGLGTALAELGEERATASGSTRAYTWTLSANRAAADLFERRGYHETRRFYEMAIELDGPVEEPALPDGLLLAVFTEADARTFHAALDDAFADHWEHHSTPFDEWWSKQRNAPDYDPTLWFVVRDGTEVAGIVRCDPERSGGGHVGAIGVRAPWRGRGVARALLARSFAEFARRGAPRVSLGVDAANATGALRLYERAGMHVESEETVFVKIPG
jgi:mycothiol synthase